MTANVTVPVTSAVPRELQRKVFVDNYLDGGTTSGGTLALAWVDMKTYETCRREHRGRRLFFPRRKKKETEETMNRRMTGVGLRPRRTRTSTRTSW